MLPRSGCSFALQLRYSIKFSATLWNIRIHVRNTQRSFSSTSCVCIAGTRQIICYIDSTELRDKLVDRMLLPQRISGHGWDSRRVLDPIDHRPKRIIYITFHRSIFTETTTHPHLLHISGSYCYKPRSKRLHQHAEALKASTSLGGA